MIALCQALERAGVVAIDMSGGSNESPQLSRYCIQPPSFARGLPRTVCEADHARRSAFPSLVAGRIIDPDDAEGMLQAGSTDFVSVGRALYADPHWSRKAFGEINAPIRKCISCNVCFERLTLEKDVACVHNPMIGTEFERSSMRSRNCAWVTARSQPSQTHARAGRRRRGHRGGAGRCGLGITSRVWEKTDAAGRADAARDRGARQARCRRHLDYRWQQIETPRRAGAHRRSTRPRS